MRAPCYWLVAGFCLTAGGARAASNEIFAADEIIVTSERRERAIRETPASIATIGAAEIDRIGADHPSEILARAPGVFIHRGSGQEHLTSIRSPVLTGGAGAGSFLFLENGVPLRSAGFANVNGLFEAHTEIAGGIEVVRGPSGALYGANAIHGVINILSRAPSEKPAALLDFSGDTIKRFKARGFFSDTRGAHGFVAGLSILSDGGFRDSSDVEQQKVTLRHDFERGAVTTATVFSATNLNQETAGFVLGPDAYLDPMLRRTNPNPDAFRDARSIRLSSRIDVAASENLTVSVTPFMRWTDMDFRLHFLPSQALEENYHWSVGAQSALYLDLSDRVSVIAGVDWEYTKGALSEVQTRLTIFSFTQGVHFDYEVSAYTAAPFGKISYEIAPRLTASAALRLDYTRYDYQNLTDSGIVGRFLRPASRTDEFLTASPKFSLLYELDGGAIYASYARGARPPQTTDLYRLQINQTANAAKAETIDAFEIGWRGAIGERLNFKFACYYMEKRNFFFRDADGFNVDDGKTRHLGGEAEVTADLGAGFSINANAAYGAHTYRFDRPVLSVRNAGEAISFGDDVDTAPRWLAGARGTWAADFLPLTAEIEWVFVGAYFTDASNVNSYPGHDLVHLRANWRLGERLSLFGAVRNLFDTFYAERADFAFGSERYFPGEERTATIGVRYQQ